MAKNSYPLCWPDGWKRTAKNYRVAGRFKVDGRWIEVGAAVRRLLKQLEMMEVDISTTLVSTNVQPRLDGMPRAGEKEPEDPGAAVYWDDGGRQRCMATDRYTTVADNLAALAATLEAMRAIERHGGAEILSRAFLGFATLPENAESWRDLLGFTNGDHVTPDSITSKFRAAVLKAHPDQGGTAEQLCKVVQARDNAMNEMGSV